MGKKEYFIKSLSNQNLLKLDWYFTFFCVFTDTKGNNPYFKVVDKKYQVKVDDAWVDFSISSIKEPIYTTADKIKLPKDLLNNLNQDTETTIGRAIANKVLLEYCFGNKIPYINEPFSISSLEGKIVDLMRENAVTVDEYLLFTDAVTFIKGLSRIVNVSATPKNILPPPGIDKYKEELIKKNEKEYGKDWVKDRVKVLELKEKLKEKDKEWLKDDPTKGKLLNKKITDNARVKMYLTFGDEVGFDKESGKMTFVANSLNQQYPTEPDQLTAMFNASRSGSYDRGKETQKGGSAAKDLLRATSSYNIKIGDCGSKLAKEILVTKLNADSLTGRYILKGNGAERIDDGAKYIGQVIKVRSPMYCANKDSSFCSVCCGDSMSLQPDGINLVILQVSDTILHIAMKSMHNSQVQFIEADIHDMIK